MKTFEQWKETFELPEGCSIRGVETSVLRIAFETGQYNPDIERLESFVNILSNGCFSKSEIKEMWEQTTI